MSKPTPMLAITVLLSLACLPLAAWGERGHRMVAQAALQDLPAQLAPWFAGQEAVMAGHASDPDHWKLHYPAERPRHYLDCEPYGGPDGVPRDPAAAQAQLGPAAFLADGQLPWTIQARVKTLATAFQLGDPHQVAFEASILSHYVGDLAVPLHTTSNHNGGETGQKGVHARWETGLLERIEAGQGWTPEPRPAQVLEDPDAAVWGWLKDSYDLVAGVLRDDLAAGRGQLVNGAYWEHFLALQGGQVKEQLAVAGQHTAELIVQAWTQAGRPRPQASR